MCFWGSVGCILRISDVGPWTTAISSSSSLISKISAIVCSKQMHIMQRVTGRTSASATYRTSFVSWLWCQLKERIQTLDQWHQQGLWQTIWPSEPDKVAQADSSAYGTQPPFYRFQTTRNKIARSLNSCLRLHCALPVTASACQVEKFIDWFHEYTLHMSRANVRCHKLCELELL